MEARCALVAMAIGTLVCAFVGCGGDDGGGGPKPVESVTVSPDSMVVEVCCTAAITATVVGGKTKAVDWYVNHLLGGDSELGTITQTNPATYTAPGIIPSAETLRIFAVSQEDNTKADTCRFDVEFSVIHVDGSSGNDETGTGTIVLPVKTIARGLELTVAGKTVEVAAGTYLEHDLEMTRGAVLRSLSGDPLDVTIDAEQQGVVLQVTGCDSTTRIEGLTITGGLTDNSGPNQAGGGINCYSSASPSISNCIITGNHAWYGSGINMWNASSPAIENCVIHGNTAVTSGAGASCWDHCAPRFVNCTFFGNSSGATASHVYIRAYSSATFLRTIMAFGQPMNAVDTLWVYGELPTVVCCDVYGNAGGDWVRPLEGMEGMNGNFLADPLFCDTLSGDFALEACSPCLPGNHPDGYACGLIGALDEGCPCGP
jgi:hypothetical protein